MGLHVGSLLLEMNPSNRSGGLLSMDLTWLLHHGDN